VTRESLFQPIGAGARRAAVFALCAAAAVAAAHRDGSSVPRLFSSEAPLALRLEAPLDDLFARGRSDDSYTVDGTMVESSGRTGDSRLRVTVALRGHTSRRASECSFPKLKLQFADPPSDDSAFAGLKRIKIGTHCGESEGAGLTERFGRLPNERSPLREAFAYRLLEALEVPTLKARTARITYVSGDPAQPLTRNALLLEDDNDAARRLGAAHVVAPETFTNARDAFSVADAANLAFAEALLGNFDWCVKFTATDQYRCDARMKLWNVLAAAPREGTARPLPYDFDVSGIVAGSHQWFDRVFNAAFVPSRSPRETEVVAQVQRTRTLFARADLDAARARFSKRKPDAYRLLESATLDADGRRIAHEYLDAFFHEIGSDETFYRPVVAATGTVPRGSGDPSAPPLCASDGPIRPGMPVSDPLRRSGPMIEVVALDALWQWAPPAKCAPVQSGTVWIPAAAVTRDFPPRD